MKISRGRWEKEPVAMTSDSEWKDYWGDRGGHFAVLLNTTSVLRGLDAANGLRLD